MNDFANVHPSRLRAIRGGLNTEAPGQGTEHRHHSRAGGWLTLFAMTASAVATILIISLCLAEMVSTHNREFAKAQKIEAARLRDAQAAGVK